jgi:hypothetical protein
MDENLAKDMGVLMDGLERFRRTCGACVLVVHHQGRSGDHMRGSTALEGAADTVLQVVRDEREITLKNPKQKNAAEFDDITLRMVPMLESVVLQLSDGATSVTQNTVAMKMAVRWWDLFGDDLVSVSRLIAAGVATERTFYRHVKELLRSAVCVKQSVGRSTFYGLVHDPDPSSED